MVVTDEWRPGNMAAEDSLRGRAPPRLPTAHLEDLLLPLRRRAMSSTWSLSRYTRYHLSEGRLGACVEGFKLL